jgi:hypothetical protein
MRLLPVDWYMWLSNDMLYGSVSLQPGAERDQQVDQRQHEEEHGLLQGVTHLLHRTHLGP